MTAMDEADWAAADYEVQMERNAQCHYGDHDYADNGYCTNCYKFNGGILQWKAQEKADREGRGHYGHYHRTLEAKQRCTAIADPEWIEAYGDVEVPS